MKSNTCIALLCMSGGVSLGRLFVRLTLLFMLLYASVVSAQAPITTAPSAPTIAVYLPTVEPQHADLINQLQSLWKNFLLSHSASVVTATDIQFRWVSDWHNYQQGVRLGRPGLYLTAPHFAAWLIHRHQFVPRMRLNSPISFVVAARRNDAQIFEINDLARRNVCAPQPLNLDYLLVNSAFDQPMLSAEIKIIRSVFSLMRKGGGGEASHGAVQCRGFALNHRQFAMLESQLPEHYIRLHQSREFSNYATVIDAQVNAKYPRLGNLFDTFLREEETQTVLAPVLAQLAEIPVWVDASKEDYPSSYFEPLQRFWD